MTANISIILLEQCQIADRADFQLDPAVAGCSTREQCTAGGGGSDWFPGRACSLTSRTLVVVTPLKRCLLLASGVLAVGDQPLVQLASENWDSVRPGLLLFCSAVPAGGADSVSLQTPAWLR